MIDAWNLVWIIPTVGALCFCFGAILASGKEPTSQGCNEREDACMCVHCPYNTRPCKDDIV